MKSDIKKIVEEQGFVFYDMEILNQAKVFRVYIDKKGGVGVADCAKLSELLSPLLDVLDPMKENYSFEVSSPGIDRKLKTLDHFSKSLGLKAKVALKEGENFVSIIDKVEEGFVYFLDGDEELKIDFENIARARLHIDF